MEKIMIKGKPYVQVNQRVLELRKNYGDKDKMFGIITRVVEWHKEKNEIIIQAEITDPTGRVVGSGIAHEWQDDKKSMVNATSYVENCETSAIGRALAAFGLGIEDAYASADEVQGAIKKQAKKKEIVTENRNDNLAEMMVPQEAIVDPYYIQYKASLAKVFVAGSPNADTEELLEFVMADFNEPAAEAAIEAHAHAHADNKDMLKQFCENSISTWKSTLNTKDYDSLVIFMKYLSGKFPEEGV
jgi:hypothetical protein